LLEGLSLGKRTSHATRGTSLCTDFWSGSDWCLRLTLAPQLLTMAPHNKNAKLPAYTHWPGT